MPPSLLVGESGSGKSTVAYTLMGIYPPSSGRILFQGNDVNGEVKKRPTVLKKEIQIVFQDPGSSLNPRRSIKQILELPLKIHRISNGKNRIEQVAKLLEMVGIPPDYMYKNPQAIGGGEKQEDMIKLHHTWLG
ncbi:MAG: ATP-binding cassette domain-containing protein [bacterium]|nr:ATP-binding cassette domain-containing protein [bacterium]